MVKFDLGFTGHISLLEENVQEIVEKSFIKTKSRWGWQGKEHQKRVYELPQFKTGRITFHHLHLEEENVLERQEAVVHRSTTKAPFTSTGKLGWKLFKNKVLFLDLGHSSIILCNDIQIFQQRGYSLEGFIQVPLLLDRDFLEFKAVTSDGLLRCMLDTGAPYNLFNREDIDISSVEETVNDEKEFTRFSTFQIGGKEFGEIAFHPLPIKTPIKIEAVLGMEFLSEHRVLIDFKNQHIYINSPA